MSLRLVHLANFHSTNIGNGALISGTERVLEEDFGVPITWHREAWDDYTFGLKSFDAAFVRRINEHDGLVIGGAVAINGRAYLSHTGTRVDLPLELWSELAKPVIFHGISYRHWAGQPFYHADRLQALVQLVTQHPRMVLGLRNDGTRGWLERLLGTRLPEERVGTVPDPAQFVRPSGATDFPELCAGRRNVLISFNDEDAEFRYGTAERRTRVIQGLAETVQQLASEWPARFILAPHYFDDFRMLAEFVAACRPQFAHQQLVTTGLVKVDAAPWFYARYARADLALSMRVHSMSPAIGLGVPVVPVVTQDRMWDYLDDAGLRDLAVDALADDFPARLHGLATAALREPGRLRGRLQSAATAQREQMRVFNHRLRGLFR